jgi:hypothetical protein
VLITIKRELVAPAKVALTQSAVLLPRGILLWSKTDV